MAGLKGSLIGSVASFSTATTTTVGRDSPGKDCIRMVLDRNWLRTPASCRWRKIATRSRPAWARACSVGVIALTRAARPAAEAQSNQRPYTASSHYPCMPAAKHKTCSEALDSSGLLTRERPDRLSCKAESRQADAMDLSDLPRVTAEARVLFSPSPSQTAWRPGPADGSRDDGSHWPGGLALISLCTGLNYCWISLFLHLRPGYAKSAPAAMP